MRLRRPSADEVFFGFLLLSLVLLVSFMLLMVAVQYQQSRQPNPQVEWCRARKLNPVRAQFTTFCVDPRTRAVTAPPGQAQESAS